MRGGASRTLVFCHANSFPAGTYGVLLEAWRRAGWRVLAPERLGHDPAYPVTNGWRHLRDELLACIDREVGSEAPVTLVGHSMGGYVGVLAASRAPARVNAVVLLDAPIISGWRVGAFGLLKATGLILQGGPGKGSARRRERWPDRDAVRAHFQGKPAFARWDPRVLDDYLRHGFEPDADDAAGAARATSAPGPAGVRLAFRRDIETRIYATMPNQLPTRLRRHPLRCPVGFVAGTRSAECRQIGLAYTRRLAGAHWRTVDGSHLFPMERPDAAAAAVLELLGEMRPR